MTPDQLRAEAARLTALAAEQEAQLSEVDVKRMYAERDFEGIEQARLSGRLADLLGTTPTTTEGI